MIFVSVSLTEKKIIFAIEKSKKLMSIIYYNNRKQSKINFSNKKIDFNEIITKYNYHFANDSFKEQKIYLIKKY